MLTKINKSEELIVPIEGLVIGPTRQKARLNVSNEFQFIVRLNDDIIGDSPCLPVYTLENELLGYVRKDINKIKQLFSVYSNPFALAIKMNNKIILLELTFSHDKVYLEELRKQVQLTKN
jgi:hypothetical protein